MSIYGKSFEDIENENKFWPGSVNEASFCVGDEIEWIVAKECAQIQAGVNALVRKLGMDEARFVTENRESIINNPDLFVCNEEDNAQSTPGYDLKKDRINKIKRNVKRTIDALVAKIKDAVAKIVSKFLKAVGKGVYNIDFKKFLTNLKKDYSDQEMHDAAKVKLSGGNRFAINTDIIKARSLVASNEIVSVFQKFLDTYGDSIDYKKAGSDASDDKTANKNSEKSAELKRKAFDDIDKFDRKLAAKLFAVIPTTSSDKTGSDIDLFTDPVYNFENMNIVITTFSMYHDEFKKCQGKTDTMFTNMIIKKSVEIEKHGNVDEVEAFISVANSVAQKYVTNIGTVVNSCMSLYTQMDILFRKFCANLGVYRKTAYIGTMTSYVQGASED